MGGGGSFRSSFRRKSFLNRFRPLSDAEVFRHLQRRTAEAADHGRAVAAGEGIVNFTRADGAVEQGMALAVGRWLRSLSHEFTRLYHRGEIVHHRDTETQGSFFNTEDTESTEKNLK